MYSVQSVSIVTDSWIQMATPPKPPSGRDSQSSVVNLINNTVVFFGGKDSSSVFNNISLFLLEKDTWAVAAPAGPLPPKRYSHSAVATAQNMMIVFGGRNGSTYFNDIAVYNMVANKWEQKNATGTIPAARIGHTAVIDSAKNQMVIFGGLGMDSQHLRDICFLDLTTYNWVSRQYNGSTIARAYHSAVVSPLNVMVVFGGTTGTSLLASTACFSLTTNTWFSCATSSQPPDARSSQTAVVSPTHKMTVFGGRDSAGTPLADVWNLDLFTYVWRSVDPTGVPMNPRYAHTAVSTPFGTMVLFGGISTDGTPSNEFAKYNLATTVLRNANDGAVLVVLITLVGTILISMCFALDYMQEQNALEKEEAIEHAKEQIAKLIPKIPLGPKAKKFLDDFKVSLDPLKDPVT